MAVTSPTGHASASGAAQPQVGMLLQAMGDLDGAMPLLREALQVKRETLGDRHASTLNSIVSLGTLLQVVVSVQIVYRIDLTRTNLGRMDFLLVALSLGEWTFRLTRAI